MRIISTIITLLLLATTSLSAASVTVDKDWYVAGERIAVDITLDDRVSAVAYLELSDTKGVQAGTIVRLSEGKGKATFVLPSALHSGYYRLSTYTRISAPVCINIPVVNTLLSSADDSIEWIATDGKTTATGSNNAPADVKAKPSSAGIEVIGHTIVARLKQPSPDASALLSVIGKQTHVFNGKQLNDSTMLFYTYGLSGKHQVVITATDRNNRPAAIDLVSPYSAYLPDSLPVLRFAYQRDEVESRSICMQQMACEARDTVAPMPYSDVVFTSTPFISYNLDEYRQFATIGDTFTEYVNFVHQSDKNGLPELFVYTDAEGYSNWKALVLIDGMPTNDIKRLMSYDARRIQYINIYNDWFSLGRNNIYKGVVSFVTRTGNITNYTPDEGSTYVVYDFPQN